MLRTRKKLEFQLARASLVTLFYDLAGRWLVWALVHWASENEKWLARQEIYLSRTTGQHFFRALNTAMISTLEAHPPCEVFPLLFLQHQRPSLFLIVLPPASLVFPLLRVSFSVQKKNKAGFRFLYNHYWNLFKMLAINSFEFWVCRWNAKVWLRLSQSRSLLIEWTKVQDRATRSLSSTCKQV